jgi:uncharacterized protein (DUF1697 family)
MKRYAALMRAVNVGGKGSLPMTDVREMLAKAGFDDPQTLLASGNAIVGSNLEPAEIERTFEAGIEQRFGFRTDVLVRDAEQLTTVMAENPFPEFAKDRPSAFIAYFLRGGVDGDLADLKSFCGFGEEIAVGPGCLYLCYPEGSGTSKLSGATIERKLKLRGTGRNWNTVGKLLGKLGG